MKSLDNDIIQNPSNTRKKVNSIVPIYNTSEINLTQVEKTIEKTAFQKKPFLAVV